MQKSFFQKLIDMILGDDEGEQSEAREQSEVIDREIITNSLPILTHSIVNSQYHENEFCRPQSHEEGERFK